jgi:cytochrome c-type biogenesis protein CcmE
MHKVTLTIVSVASVVVGLLAMQAMRGGTSTVLKPSDLASLSKSESRERIRVAGRVISTGMSYQVEPKLELLFSITDPGAKQDNAKYNQATPDKTSQSPLATNQIPVVSIPVLYNGIKPDMFSEGRDVIIDGDFRNGRLEAVKLLTQCPSKYQPPKPTDSKTSSTATTSATADNLTK